jgi:hypothetical protein
MPGSRYVLFLKLITYGTSLKPEFLRQVLLHLLQVILSGEELLGDSVLDPCVKSKPVLNHFFDVLVDVLKQLGLQSLSVGHFH